MMATREPLEWHFKQLDHAVGLSFKGTTRGQDIPHQYQFINLTIYDIKYFQICQLIFFQKC